MRPRGIAINITLNHEEDFPPWLADNAAYIPSRKAKCKEAFYGRRKKEIYR
jgi:hypothetical protein